jgi:ribonuclease HI
MSTPSGYVTPQPTFTIASDRECDETHTWAHTTGIYVRARDSRGKIRNADIAQLDRESLWKFLTFYGGSNQVAENIVGILLGHGPFHEQQPVVAPPPSITSQAIDRYVGYFCGSVNCRGHAACGCVIFNMRGVVVAHRGLLLLNKTQIEAEYCGLITLFELAKECNITDIYVRGDSSDVVKQVSGMREVPEELMPLYISVLKNQPSVFKIAYVRPPCSSDAYNVMNSVFSSSEKRDDVL